MYNIIITTSFFFLFIITLLYGKIYWNGAEYNGKFSSTSFRKWKGWKYIQQFLRFYFNLKIEFEDDCNKYSKSPKLFTVYPHGLYPISIFWYAGLCGPINKETQQLIYNEKGELPFIAATKLFFLIPGIREFFLMCGIVSADKKTLLFLLQTHSVFLYPGGIQEAILPSQSKQNKLDLYLEHEGFLDVVNTAQIPIVIIICVNENNLFKFISQFQFLKKITIKCFGYPFPTFFWPIPRHVPITIHIGKEQKNLATTTKSAFKLSFYQHLKDFLHHIYKEEQLSEELNQKLEQKLK